MTPDLYDNTRLSDFKRCPRKYYFRHVLDWVPHMKQLPLIFGSAWHKAMEYIWEHAPADLARGVKSGDIALAAHEEFLKEWELLGLKRVLSADEEHDMSPRTPNVALHMLRGYVDARAHIFRNPTLKVLQIEKPFVVPLDPERDDQFYIGRIDKIVEFQGKVLAVEHKTTSQYRKNGPFRTSFVDSFSPNAQVDGYQYALHLLYPEGTGGVWVDASLVHKSEAGFMFIPIERKLQMLDSWLWEVRYWIEMVKMNREELERARPEHSYLAAFPKNTNACFDFGRSCEYLDLCKAWPNPVGKPPPINMKVEHWDPLDHIGPVKDLDKLLIGSAT